MKTWALRWLGWAFPLSLYVLFSVGCGSGGASSATNAGGQTPSPTIAFQSNRAQNSTDAEDGPLIGTFNIWVMNSKGLGAKPLTSFSPQAEPYYGLGMAWSPDGHRIAFDSYGALDGSNGPAVADNIWIANPDGSGATPLTKLSTVGANSSWPVWSPDGSKLVFNSARALDGTDAVNIATPDGTVPANGVSNIWVINADGSGATPLTRITAANADALSPEWSPDGSKLAFASRRALDGTNAVDGSQCSPQQLQLVCPVFNIWMMNADGSGATPLTDLSAGLADSDLPAWSPDGKKLVFTSTRALDGTNATNYNRNIWVINADGSGATPLTRLTKAEATGPAWSPDGKTLAFDSTGALDDTDNFNSSGGNVWMMNADGSNATPLTKLTHSGAGGPVWSPDGSKLAFGSDRALDGTDAIISANGANIWVMNADGSNAAPLTKLTQAACTNPQWNPATTH